MSYKLKKMVVKTKKVVNETMYMFALGVLGVSIFFFLGTFFGVEVAIGGTFISVFSMLMILNFFVSPILPLIKKENTAQS